MKNQQEQNNLNNLDNNIYYNEKIMLELKKSKEKLGNKILSLIFAK